MFIERFAACVMAGLLLIGTAHAQALTVEDFYSEPRMKEAALSPSGRYLAVAVHEGGQEALVVRDLDTGQSRALTTYENSPEKGASIRFIQWKSEDRLIFAAQYINVIRSRGAADGDVNEVEYGNAVYAINRDGSAATHLLGNQLGARMRTAYTGLDIVNILAKDPDHILIQYPSGAFGLSVHKVNIQTGRGSLLEPGPATQWITDKDGNVVARVAHFTRNVRLLQTRDPGGTIWKERVRINLSGDNDRPDFSILGASNHSDKLYALVESRGKLGANTTNVRTFDLTTNEIGDAVFAHPTYDVSSIVRDPRTSMMVGACYYVDMLECAFTDADTNTNFRALARFFENSRNIEVISQSWDNRYWLLDVTGPQDRGTLYRYDWQRKHVEPIGPRWPQLPAAKLGVTEAYKYRARDGLDLTGYLTVPRSQAKPPLVVMPHGGPTARDSMRFDHWAQFLGSRGYAVFQPNFRGSSGYGRAFQEMGYGRWGGEMQNDITDGVQDLIAKGRVDPDRICIVGASYGGYAALYGGARQPELYKCVVSIAGVSSLPDLLAETKDIFGLGAAYEERSRWVGDERNDRARMVERSPITHARAFKPPLLLYHGEFDERVRLSHSRKMEAEIRHGGGNVRLTIYRREGHPYFTPFHEKQMLTEIDAFLGQHIGAK